MLPRQGARGSHEDSSPPKKQKLIGKFLSDLRNSLSNRTTKKNDSYKITSLMMPDPQWFYQYISTMDPDMNSLKNLAIKDKNLHNYAYNGLCLPITNIEITKAEFVNNVLVLQTHETVQFWKEKTEVWEKVGEFTRQLARGYYMWTDSTRFIKEKNMIIYSELWDIDPYCEEKSSPVLHLCIWSENGTRMKRIVPINCSRKYINAVHCIHPDVCSLFAGTYMDPNTRSLKTVLLECLFNGNMDHLSCFITCAEVDGAVSSIGYSERHKNLIVVHCDPFINIFNRNRIILHSKINLGVIMHVLHPGRKRHLKSVETNKREGFFLTFKSSDGVVEEIFFERDYGTKRVVRRFFVQATGFE